MELGRRMFWQPRPPLSPVIRRNCFCSKRYACKDFSDVHCFNYSHPGDMVYVNVKIPRDYPPEWNEYSTLVYHGPALSKEQRKCLCVCVFYDERGRCPNMRGKGCRYMHHTFPCLDKFSRDGRCSRQPCRFSHNPNLTQAQRWVLWTANKNFTGSSPEPPPKRRATDKAPILPDPILPPSSPTSNAELESPIRVVSDSNSNDNTQVALRSGANEPNNPCSAAIMPDLPSCSTFNFVPPPCLPFTSSSISVPPVVSIRSLASVGESLISNVLNQNLFTGEFEQTVHTTSLYSCQGQLHNTLLQPSPSLSVLNHHIPVISFHQTPSSCSLIASNVVIPIQASAIANNVSFTQFNFCPRPSSPLLISHFGGSPNLCPVNIECADSGSRSPGHRNRVGSWSDTMSAASEPGECSVVSGSNRLVIVEESNSLTSPEATPGEEIDVVDMSDKGIVLPDDDGYWMSPDGKRIIESQFVNSSLPNSRPRCSSTPVQDEHPYVSVNTDLCNLQSVGASSTIEFYGSPSLVENSISVLDLKERGAGVIHGLASTAESDTNFAPSPTISPSSLTLEPKHSFENTMAAELDYIDAANALGTDDGDAAIDSVVVNSQQTTVECCKNSISVCQSKQVPLPCPKPVSDGTLFVASKDDSVAALSANVDLSPEIEVLYDDDTKAEKGWKLIEVSIPKKQELFRKRHLDSEWKKLDTCKMCRMKDTKLHYPNHFQWPSGVIYIPLVPIDFPDASVSKIVQDEENVKEVDVTLLNSSADEFDELLKESEAAVSEKDMRLFDPPASISTDKDITAKISNASLESPLSPIKRCFAEGPLACHPADSGASHLSTTDEVTGAEINKSRSPSPNNSVDVFPVVFTASSSDSICGSIGSDFDTTMEHDALASSLRTETGIVNAEKNDKDEAVNDEAVVIRSAASEELGDSSVIDDIIIQDEDESPIVIMLSCIVPDCPEAAPGLQEIQNHELDCHPADIVGQYSLANDEVPRVNQCPLCSPRKVFDSRMMLLVHLSDCLTERGLDPGADRTNSKCPMCDRKGGLGYLVNHLAKQHCNCPRCGRRHEHDEEVQFCLRVIGKK